ncbi:MAG: hypothetical protein IJN07_05815 [Clostridia bacterium]|nr:hypothetical protein [Clostridia bacterium]
MADYAYKRVTLFAGHYGSGKTNLAVNFALRLKEEGHPVKIADLDIVNPYFRTKDSAKRLQAAGIELISPAFANTNVDLPALPAQVYSLVERRDSFAVLDIGGDDRGAYALGRYRDQLLKEQDFEMVFVVNFYRPLTRSVDEAIDVMREIEGACGMPFTAIINNSNIGNDTTPQTVAATFDKAAELSEKTGLPVIFTSGTQRVLSGLSGENLFPLHLQEKYFDIKENEHGEGNF